jgi:tetratricopeptide (TPR) repeat protein
MLSVVKGINSRFLQLLRGAHFTKAAELAEDFLALYDKSPDLNFNLAALLESQKKYEAALRYACRAVELDSDHKEAHDLLGYLFFTIGNYESALNSYKEALRVSPQDAMAWYNLGCVHEALDKTEEAESAWKEAISLDEKSSGKKADRKTAKRVLSHSLIVHDRPAAFFAHLALGKSYDAKELMKDALVSFDRASHLVPGEPETFFELGKVYFKLGNRDKARQAFQKYLDLGGIKTDEVRLYLEKLKMSGSCPKVLCSDRAT